MQKPYAIVLLITEKNCSKKDIDQFISLLEGNHNFRLMCSKYTSDNQHGGTLLVKSVDGDEATSVLKCIREELENIEPFSMKKFNCQLSVAGFDIDTDTIFVN